MSGRTQLRNDEIIRIKNAPYIQREVNDAIITMMRIQTRIYSDAELAQKAGRAKVILEEIEAEWKQAAELPAETRLQSLIRRIRRM